MSHAQRHQTEEFRILAELAYDRYYFLIDETGKIAWKSTNNSLIATEKLVTDIGQFAKK